MVARLLVVLAVCVSSGCCCCTMPMGNPNLPPTSPDPLFVSRQVGDQTAVDLQWGVALHANSYVVYQRTPGGVWQMVPGVPFGATKHTVRGLNPQQKYEFRVDATGPGGTTQGTPAALDPLPPK